LYHLIKILLITVCVNYSAHIFLSFCGAAAQRGL